MPKKYSNYIYKSKMRQYRDAVDFRTNMAIAAAEKVTSARYLEVIETGEIGENIGYNSYTREFTLFIGDELKEYKIDTVRLPQSANSG